MGFCSASKSFCQKFFPCLLILFSFSAPFYAQKNNNNASMNKTANLLEDDTFFKRGVFRNSDEITEIAKTLPLENRQMLYNRYAEDVRTPFWMNAVAGFGLGSFMQKNYIHAGIQATGDTIFTILDNKCSQLCFKTKGRA